MFYKLMKRDKPVTNGYHMFGMDSTHMNMARLNLGSIDLGDHDQDWFVVMSKLRGRSTRANLSSVVGHYVRRHKEEYREILTYTARKYGLTEKECFQRLLKGDDLGEPLEDFSESEPIISDEG
ncbi:MAG: hypothetical protein F6J86_14770 [Symploca sp. SIO1B1]|nr:hypothetical protein [Symploca sp. SIO1B1]